MFGRAQRRRRLAGGAFPPAWAAILVRNVGFHRRLPPADQRELEGHIQVFLAEKLFEGCGGLTITDEIRVTIAANACLLLLHRTTDYYPQLTTVLVYPHVFIVERVIAGPAGQVLESEQVLAGESWRHGAVILAWDQVPRAASTIQNGRNVILHEFAHQLDEECGTADGVPVLPHRSMYVAWARALGQDYAALVRDTEQGHITLLDSYGSKNPAEFFAVATEFFFEMPVQVRTRHPDLYEVLKSYYCQDPAARIAEGDPRLHCRVIAYGSPEYAETLALRDEILRKPLGLCLTEEQRKAESRDHHLACYRGDRLAGCLVLTPVSDGAVKMRQVAVAADCQRQGIGTQLVAYAERIAADLGFRVMTAHAREVAVPFYARIGYTVSGPPFIEVGLPHFEIGKNLPQTDLPKVSHESGHL